MIENTSKNDVSHKNPEPLEPEPADSWEKLEKDAMKCACDILGSANLRCRDCEWAKNGVGCQEGARLEILKRAKKLARHALRLCPNCGADVVE